MHEKSNEKQCVWRQEAILKQLPHKKLLKFIAPTGCSATKCFLNLLQTIVTHPFCHLIKEYCGEM